MACGGFEALVDCRFIPTLIAVAVILAVATWVLVLDFARRVHRAFALFLFVFAGVTGLVAFSSPADDVAGRLRAYFIIAAPFAAAYFAYVYRLRYARGAVARAKAGRPWIPLTILGGVTVAEILYLADHALWTDCTSGTCDDGPLSLAFPLAFVSFAAIGLLFAVDFLDAKPSPCRRALYLASLGFALLPLHTSGFLFTFSIANNFMLNTGNGVRVVDSWLWAAPGLLVAGQAGYMAWRARGAEPETARAIRRILAILPLPLATGVGMASAVLLWPDLIVHLVRTTFIITAIWTVTMPALIAYSLARHQLFDIDLRIRIAISRTTLASVFVAVFFVVSEGTADLVGDRLGGDPLAVLLGIVAAGMLLFALHPLQTWANRVADATMPGAKSHSEMTSNERLELYREQSELAWLDGRLTAKERLLLDRLRDRIGLTVEQAHRIEADAMGPIQGSSSRRRKAPTA